MEFVRHSTHPCPDGPVAWVAESERGAERPRPPPRSPPFEENVHQSVSRWGAFVDREDRCTSRPRATMPPQTSPTPPPEGGFRRRWRAGGRTLSRSAILSGHNGNHGFVPRPAILGSFAARRPIRFSSLDAKPELPYALAPEEFRGADRPLPVMIETRVSARDVHSARADGGENAPLRRAFAKPRSSRRRRDELPAPFGFGATILFHSGFSGDVGLSGVDRGRALHRGFQQTAQEDQR